MIPPLDPGARLGFQIDPEAAMAMVGELLKRCTTEKPADGGDDKKELADLPDDVLADVFRRLAPRWLAASRCVCRDWRAAIGGLLRADLLPLSFLGIFLHFGHHKFPELFARPSSSTISGMLDFLPTSMDVSDPRYYHDFHGYHIMDHCNGLLLLTRYVVNPATRRCDPLPLLPLSTKPVVPHYEVGHVNKTFNNYLVFDPTVSPHYEVFMVPRLFSVGRGEEWYDFDPLVEESRWPSSTCILYVFSSKTGHWEERSFVREGDAPRTGVKFRSLGWQERAVYWRGALYVHREANFVVRISLTSNKYCVIKPPVGMGLSLHPTRYLERSQNGVYFAALDEYRLRVWILAESSSGQMEWMSKHNNDLEPALAHRHRRQAVHGPWVLKDVNYNLYRSHLPEYKKKHIIEDKFGWNSDSDEVQIEGCCSAESSKAIDNGYTVEDDPDPPFFCDPEIIILGFHPYREIVFLSCKSTEEGLAYHLNSSKVEGLGTMHPTSYKGLDNVHPPNYILFENAYNTRSRIISNFFTYTPCWLEEFHI